MQVRRVAGCLTAVLLIAPASVSAQTYTESRTDGSASGRVLTAQAAYKRRVESVEFDTRRVTQRLDAAAESRVGSPAAGGSGAISRASRSTLPGCYNHVVASTGGELRYGHICPGYGGYRGGAGAELFGIGEIVLRDPVTGEVTATIPAPDLTTSGATTITISSATLAQFAAADLRLPAPTIGMSPDGDHVTQLPSWLWIDRGQWSARDRTATAGPVSATVTATPVRVDWDMGNGDTVTCDGPGRVYERRFAGRPEATDCRYTYRHSSATRAGAPFTVVATVVWDVSWTGSDGAGGALGELTSTATRPVVVGEVQALVQ